MIQDSVPPEKQLQYSIPMEKEFTILFDRPLIKTDRRAHKRYRCGPANLVQLHLTGTAVNLDAWASNLSEGGIGLNLPYPLELETALVLRLRGRRTLSMAARVVHVTEQVDGTWRIGCAFERPLDPDALETVL
jgi:hypothetical protein